MTFTAVADPDVLSDTISPISALVDECKVHLKADGLEIAAVDPANVGMASVEVDPGAFAHFSASGGLIGIDLDRFEDVLSMAGSDDMVRLNLDEETRKLHIDIGGLEYTLALIDPDSIRQEPEIPDLDLPGRYVFEASQLSRGIKAADLCSDHVAIEAASKDEVRITAEGDTDDVEVTITDDDLLSGHHETGSTVSSLFSLDYLQDMDKPIGAETETSLLVGDEMPIKVRYSLGDGAVKVQNLLAPRIQND